MKAKPTGCTCSRCSRASSLIELRARVWPLVVPVVVLPATAPWARIAPFVTRWGKA